MPALLKLSSQETLYFILPNLVKILSLEVSSQIFMIISTAVFISFILFNVTSFGSQLLKARAWKIAQLREKADQVDNFREKFANISEKELLKKANDLRGLFNKEMSFQEIQDVVIEKVRYEAIALAMTVIVRVKNARSSHSHS